MNASFKRWVPYGLVAGTSVWIAFSNTALGDYPIDAGPAVRALVHGDLSAYFNAHAMMGPVATLVEAPFAALAGGDGLAAYQWACVPCLLAVGMLGLYLAGLARRRGASVFASSAIGVLCLVNPLTFSAVWAGHPEELLTAALAIGAVASASEGRVRRTTLLLGLAVASKQWAVIAILPALMALPSWRARRRVGLRAAAIVVALMLPGLLSAPGSFASVQVNAASTGRFANPWSVWYPATSVNTLHVGPERLTARVHEAPPLVGSLSHPLIVLLTFGLPVALAMRRRRFGLSGSDAMALLALLAFLRCALDPVDNLYYHEPLLLALIGWDALASRGLPVRGLAGTAVALFFWHWSHNLTNVSAFNAAYLTVAAIAAIVIGSSLFRGIAGHLCREPDFWLDEAQISGIK